MATAKIHTTARMIVVEPGKEPEVREIEKDHESLQKMVGLDQDHELDTRYLRFISRNQAVGLIFRKPIVEGEEPVEMDESFNKIVGLYDRKAYEELLIYGTFLIVKVNFWGNVGSLTDEEAERWVKAFKGDMVAIV